MNSIQKIEIVEVNNQLVIDSRLVAKGLEIEHESFMRAIYKYQNQLEEFGTLRFEIGMNQFIKKDGKKGATTYKHCFLNEDQVYLIVALSKNNDTVVEFKSNLIKSFKKVRQELEAVTSQVKEFKDKTLDQLSEDEIRDSLILLDSRNFSRWKWEASFTDPLRPALPNGERTRRYDAIALFGRVVRILELKAKPISSVEVAEILDERGYLEVAASHYPNKCIDIILVGTELTESGKRALERLGAETEYKEFTVAGVTYRAKIRFQPIEKFAGSIAAKTLKECPATAKWVVLKDISNYKPLFPKHFLDACKKVVTTPAIEPA
jgi:phage regulator Rha-like protein